MQVLEMHAQNFYRLDMETWRCGSQDSVRLKDLATLDKEKWSFIRKHAPFQQKEFNKNTLDNYLHIKIIIVLYKT